MKTLTIVLALLSSTPSFAQRLDPVCECKFYFFQRHTGRTVPPHQEANICAMYPGPNFREGKKYRNELQQYNRCIAGNGRGE
jgi:hypothetical protein